MTEAVPSSQGTAKGEAQSDLKPLVHVQAHSALQFDTSVHSQTTQSSPDLYRANIPSVI